MAPDTKSALPEVNEAVAHALALWIKSREGQHRTPLGAAKLFTLAVLLHRERTPFPAPKEAAYHIGVSPAWLGLMIAQRAATKDVKLTWRPGKGKGMRYVVPSGRIIKAVADAEIAAA